MGDTFSFWGIASFSTQNLYDERRDTIMGATTFVNEYIQVTLSSDTKARVCVIFDAELNRTNVESIKLYKFPSGGSLTYIGDFTIPDTGPIFIYFNETSLRYWIEFNFSSTQVMSLGQIVLSDYTELPQDAMFTFGSRLRLTSDIDPGSLDTNHRVKANRRNLALKFNDNDPDAWAIAEEIFAAAREDDDGREHPIFIHLDPDDDGESLYWTKLVGDVERETVDYQRYSYTMDFQEVAKNYAI